MKFMRSIRFTQFFGLQDLRQVAKLQEFQLRRQAPLHVRLRGALDYGVQWNHQIVEAAQPLNTCFLQLQSSAICDVSPPILHSPLVVAGYIIQNLLYHSLRFWRAKSVPFEGYLPCNSQNRRWCQSPTVTILPVCHRLRWKFQQTILYIFVILFGQSYSWNMLELVIRFTVICRFCSVHHV